MRTCVRGRCKDGFRGVLPTTLRTVKIAFLVVAEAQTSHPKIVV